MASPTITQITKSDYTDKTWTQDGVTSGAIFTTPSDLGYDDKVYMRLTFTAAQETSLSLACAVSSNTSFAYLVVGAVDVENSFSDNYISGSQIQNIDGMYCMSGNTDGSYYNETITRIIPAGDHFIDIWYYKTSAYDPNAEDKAIVTLYFVTGTDAYSKYIAGYTNGYDVEIWRKNWAGDVIYPKALSTNGLTLNFNDGDIENTLTKTTLDITFYDDDNFANFDDFFTADATRYKVFLIKDEAVIWTGYITPDSFEYSTGVPVSVTARDNIGYLEQLDFDITGLYKISDIITLAQERISWAANPIIIDSEQSYKSTENGAYFSQYIDCTSRYYEDTWYDVLSDLLNGHQLRYVGNNNWIIAELTQLYPTLDLLELVNTSSGSATWSVVPSWRKLTLSHDYGVKDELFGDWDFDKTGFTFVADQDMDVEAYPGLGYTGTETYSIERASVYSNSGIGEGYFLSNDTFNNASYATAPYAETLLIALSKLTVIRTDADLTIQPGLVFSPYVETVDFGSGGDMSLTINIEYYMYPMGKRSEYYIGASYDDESELIHCVPYSYDIGTSSNVALHDMTTTLYIVITYTTKSGIVYYLAEDWQTDSYIITFTSSTESSNSRDSFDSAETVSRTINISSLPSEAGQLKFEMYCTVDLSIVPYFYYSAEKNELRPLSEMSAIGFKEISMAVEVSKESNDVIGYPNPSGNTKKTITAAYSETPKELGGAGVMANGLFTSDYESTSGWSRDDEKGGVLNLSELIARSYTHIYNGIYRNGERSGGLTLKGNIPFSDFYSMLKEPLSDDDFRKYIITQCSWNLARNTASITAQQVVDYVHDESIEFTMEYN